LVRFDRDRDHTSEGAFTHYEHDPEDPNSLSHDFVWSIYEDPAGDLWIATSEGLNRFDRATGQFITYTTEDGLANDNVMCILADEQSHLWLGTDGGLSRFDPATETFKSYDVGDGLTSNVIILGSCHRSQDGEMFFGTLDGFNAFYPADVRDNPHVPPVVLTAFRKFDEVVEFDAPLSEVEEIILTYEDAFFAFEFAALDFTEPAKNQYAYKLGGFDKDWIYCGTRRYASYTSVPPGKYTFHVKGTNNDGLWNERGWAIHITITPPFWETWWFRILAVVVVAGVVGVAVRNRLRSIARLRESEERFRALFENAPLCVFELDMTHSPPLIIRVNQQSEKTFGWSEVEFAATSLDKILPVDARPNVQRMMDSLNVGQTPTSSWQRAMAHFTARWKCTL
jgi:PAS domain S-box-containing protein